MVLADAQYLTQEAITFWRRQLRDDVSAALQAWLAARVEETQILWGNVGRLDRSRRMWKELSEQLEARDPTNPWTRNYDGLYFDSQLMTLTRSVHSSRRNTPRKASLDLLLDEFEKRPELLGALFGKRAPELLHEAADPATDKRELNRLLRPLMPWRDRVVAHIELDPRLPALAWSELDDAIDGAIDVFRRYSLRLTGVSYEIEHVKPMWQEWQKMFTQPLFSG